MSDTYLLNLSWVLLVCFLYYALVANFWDWYDSRHKGENDD